MCQINTDPMVHRSGYVQVVVPPTIVHTGQPRDMVVRNRVDQWNTHNKPDLNQSSTFKLTEIIQCQSFHTALLIF